MQSIEGVQTSAGLIVIKDNKVLLVNPVGSISTGHFSFPKGLVKCGENTKDTAIRETFEEVGLKFDLDQFTGNEYLVNYVNSGVLTKRVFLYSIILKDSEIPDTIPNEYLQKDEIQSAGFFTKKEALIITFWRFRHLFLSIKELNVD